ncbi:hypothetical protein B0I37DRAFT_440447 [Chaetomium sp. MPI-CAGE-AT-0009]|nr:hypothetical protein B0I37DRAFT_440447 [Chaetomium sp. MPI-CAGE-AT-0009]
MVLITDYLDVTTEEMDSRRLSILNAIHQAVPQTRRVSPQSMLESAAEFAFNVLFSSGYRDPSVGVGADFVAWNVDFCLSGRYQEYLGDPVAHENLRDEQPNPREPPYSEAFRKYQLYRLAQEAEPVPPQPANPIAESSNTKSNTQNNQAQDTHSDTDTPEQQPWKLAIGTITHRQPQTNQPPSPPTTATARDKGKLPAGSAAHTVIDATPSDPHARLRTLTADQPTPPRDIATWPRFVWRAVYGRDAPPADGDFFAVRLREAWLPHSSDAVLGRARAMLPPTVRVEARERESVVLGEDDGEQEGEGTVSARLLAVVFEPWARPTSARDLGYLGEVWGDVGAWHDHMMGCEEGAGCDLDVFMRERLLDSVAAAFAGYASRSGRE